MLEFLEKNAWALTLIRVAVVVLATVIILRANRHFWKKNPENRNHLIRRFTFNIVQAAIFALGIILAVEQIPQLSQVARTVLAGSGIVALAISLSAQESLANIIGGIFLSVFRPFDVGDRITLVTSRITGNVEDITLRHTIIKTFTNTRVIVPNSTMSREIVENSEINGIFASAFIDVTVAYEANIDEAMAIMAEVIGSHPAYFDTRPEEDRERTPKVRVYVRELGASGIALRASMWTRTVDENFAACSDVRLQIKKAYDAAGIEIPYSKVTVLRQDAPRDAKSLFKL